VREGYQKSHNIHSLDNLLWADTTAFGVRKRKVPPSPTEQEITFYACPFCGKTFDTAADLERHASKKHKIDMKNQIDPE